MVLSQGTLVEVAHHTINFMAFPGFIQEFLWKETAPAHLNRLGGCRDVGI